MQKKREKLALLAMLSGIFLISAPLPSSMVDFLRIAAFLIFFAGAVWFYRSI